MKIGVVGVFKFLFKCKSGVLPSLCCLQGWWIALFPLLLNQPLLQSLLLSPNCVSQPSSGPESGTAWNRQFLRITSQYLIWKCRAYSRERWYMYTYVCACICASYFSHVWLLCDPMDCSPPGSSIHGVLQARTLEWVTMPSSRGSSQLRDRTHILYVSCIVRWVLYH